MSKWLRWALLVPAVLLVFYLCVAGALAIYWLAAARCPQTLITEGQCSAGYLLLLKEFLLLLAPAMAAVAMLYVAYRLAPSYKLTCLLITLVLGTAAALYFALDSGYWWTFALTEIASLGVVLRCYLSFSQEKRR